MFKLSSMASDYPYHIAESRSEMIPMYDNAMQTMHSLFDSNNPRNLQLANKCMAEKSMDLGDAMLTLQGNRRRKGVPSIYNPDTNIRFSYEIEWNISFRDNIKNQRAFIPTITIQIVRIEFKPTSSVFFLESRVVVAEFSCLLLRDKDESRLLGVDSEVRVFESPCAGLFQDSPILCAFVGQAWGKVIILLGALFCALLGATQQVHTVSNESRHIYGKYFESFKELQAGRDDDDHFELPSSEALIKCIERELNEIFKDMQNNDDTAEAGRVMKYNARFALPCSLGPLNVE